MKFNLIKSSQGINKYLSEDESLELKFYKYSRAVILERKNDGERISLLYEELAELFFLKSDNE